MSAQFTPRQWQGVAETRAENERLRSENLRLWARDHARGHRFTRDCPVCVKFAPSSEKRP